MTPINDAVRRLSSLLLLFVCAWAGNAGAADIVTYYHTDGLGTPVMESNASGQVTYAREHRPYGEQVLGVTKNGPGFTGHVGDADTGLTYMQQRYYDPAAGRFISNDPVAADSATGANFNRYWYAYNNPYKFTDPDGRVPRGSLDLCSNGCSIFDGGGGGREDRGEKTLEKTGFGAAALGPMMAAIPMPWRIPMPLPKPGDSPTNQKLAELIAKQIAGIKERVQGPDAEQYALIATHTRTITDVRGNVRDLKEGDIYKIGQTTNSNNRYSQAELSRLGVRYEAQFYGKQRDVLIVEKVKLFDYFIQHGELPPGNRIFK